MVTSGFEIKRDFGVSSAWGSIKIATCSIMFSNAAPLPDAVRFGNGLGQRKQQDVPAAFNTNVLPLSH
jgi:hypothetical protein